MKNKEAEKETLNNEKNANSAKDNFPKDKMRFTEKQLEKLVHHLESMRIAQYMELLERPWRLIATNFVAGIARGLGIAIGASIVFALFLAFLKQLIFLNIPWIGDFIANVIQIVEKKTGNF